MRKFATLLLALLLVACEHKPWTPPPLPPAPAGWTPASCADFDFPIAGLAGYCYNGSIKPRLGQTITMTFTITGDVSKLVPDGDAMPPTLHLFLWRAGDNVTCIGAMQQYRWWSARTELKAGTTTVAMKLAPENWTDCYGGSGSANPALFEATLNDLRGVGFTFGGRDFAGHGIRSEVAGVHFHLDSYTTGLSHKRRHR